jgi:hypothetical protein
MKPRTRGIALMAFVTFMVSAQIVMAGRSFLRADAAGVLVCLANAAIWPLLASGLRWPASRKSR